MISFDNTEIAFKGKTDKDLKRAHMLFNLVGKPSLVKIGKVFTPFALKMHLPIKGLIKSTIFKQFCGGETIEECTQKTIELANYGIGTILDYSVEGKTTAEDFDHTVKEIISTVYAAKGNPKIPFAVFKITGIAEFKKLENCNQDFNTLNEEQQYDLKQIMHRVDQIARAAYESNVPLFIDAEETWIQDTIDQIAFEMMLKYNKEKAIIFNTLQMYRHDRINFLRKAIQQAKEHQLFYGIKLVRGAYMEKERERAKEKGYPSPIQPNKEATDRDFNLALEIILSELNHLALCAGTHNEDSSLLLTTLVDKYQIAKTDSRIYFAQLLGMSDHISYNLADANYNVAKYVPYGPVNEVLPYLLRRADENTSVAGQTGRELSLIIKERKRRGI